MEEREVREKECECVTEREESKGARLNPDLRGGTNAASMRGPQPHCKGVAALV